MLEESDLTPAERALCAAAAAARLLDCRARRRGEDNPAQGRAWDEDRQIRAQLLHQLLTGNGYLDQTFGPPVAVRLRGAQITGRLNLGGLTLRCPLELDACFLGGRLDLAKAKAPDVSLRGSYIGQSLSARRLQLEHTLNLEGLHCHGPVKLAGAHIGGQLDCEGARFTNPNGTALHLAYASVPEAVLMRPAGLEGAIDLTAARVGNWYDDKATWPAALRLEGFVYDAIYAPNVTPRQRLDWLRCHQGGYVPQPYEQLAAAYRRAGNREGARTVAIAKQRARRAQARRWWVRWPSRAWSGFLRWTIGYGYRPALVLPWLAGLFVVGWLVFDRAYPTHLRPAKSGLEQPEFNPARYALDLLLPVANLGQRDGFVPHGYAAWWAFGLSLAGSLLAAVVVAGLTGVFKRD